MKKLFIGQENALTKRLNADLMPISTQVSDRDLDAWVKQNLNGIEEDLTIFTKLRQDLDLLRGLRLALHIRLCSQLNEKVRFSPIVLLTEEDLSSIISSQLNTGNTEHIFKALFARGIYLKSTAEIMRSPELKYIGTNKTKIQEDISKLGFLRDETDLNHSIRNKYGAFLLSCFVGEESNKATFEKSSNLYEKYIQNNLSYRQVEFNLKIEGKVLLIDDNHEYWKPALEKFLDIKDIDYVSYENSEIKFINEIENVVKKDAHDIIFLDLRLMKSEESKNLIPSEYSGYKILRKIKSLNKGTQVIILTASNKAWNMKELVKAGADGYYIKEGPGDFSISDSIENFNSLVEDVYQCMQRTYLRKLWILITKINNNIQSSLTSTVIDGNIAELKDFISSVKTNMDIAFSLLNGNNSKRLAFLILYQILEDYVKLPFIYEVGDDNNTPSKVFLKDKSAKNVYGLDENPVLSGNIKCNFKFKSGRYSYQTGDSQSSSTYKVEFKVDSFKPKSNTKHQTQETTLFKLISTFKERHDFDEDACNTLLEITYLRSNLCGHLTGNIDLKKRDIEVDDILKLLKVIHEIL